MTSYIAGVGCSTAATPDEIVALIRACCAEAAIAPSELVALASHVRKAASHDLMVAALQLDLPLRFLDDGEIGAPGVCEAVAAAAGPLRLGKRKSAYVTCAIAACAPGFALHRFGQPASPSATIAASTEATSWAGP